MPTELIKIYKDGFDAEIVFLLELQSKLPKNYSVEQTTDKHCCVDYVVRVDGQIVMYLEIKTRFDKRLPTFGTLIIGRIKLETIFATLDKPTIIIWDGRPVKDSLYYKFFTDDMLEEKVFRDKKTGKKICYIGKGFCSTGIQSLVDVIVWCDNLIVCAVFQSE